jgi:hypothetical protein
MRNFQIIVVEKNTYFMSSDFFPPEILPFMRLIGKCGGTRRGHK